jgi:hypothetical protein
MQSYIQWYTIERKEYDIVMNEQSYKHQTTYDLYIF